MGNGETQLVSSICKKLEINMVEMASWWGALLDDPVADSPSAPKLICKVYISKIWISHRNFLKSLKKIK